MPHSSGKRSAIVVGGGLSGCSAAHTLISGGTHVTLLERNPFLGGNSTKATSGINGAGTRTQEAMGIDDGYDQFLEDMVRSATGVKDGPMPAPYPLAEVFAGNSREAVHWIQDDFNLPLDVVSRMGGHTRQRTHRTKAGGKFPGMEITSALMKRFEDFADRDDGTCDLYINSSVKSLLKSADGRVNGVTFQDADGNMQEVFADAVVLCTGGFGAGGAVKGSLLEKIRPDLMHLPTTNGDHSLGEGITVAMDIGAKAVSLKHVQVHPTGLVNPSDPDNKTKFLAAEALRGEGGILLDNQGQRFCNDIGKRDYVSGSMWSHDKGPYRLVLNSAAAAQMPWHCKHYVSRRVMKHFKSGADLAKEMGIPTEQLAASFADYNHAAETEDDKFGKIFFTNMPVNIDDSFYVAQVTPVVHYTMGGLAISPKSECVYEANNRVIPGLYAAGELAGGIHGRNRLGGSALAECVVFGRVAGKNCLDYVNSGPWPVSAGAGGEETTTVVSIPQLNGAEPITVTTTTKGAGAAKEVEGEVVDILEWDEEITTTTSGLTAGADGTEGGAAAAAAADDDDDDDDGEVAARKPKDTGPATDVAVVFGSFFMGDSERDAEDILSMFPEGTGLSVAPAPVEGNDFDFNKLKDTKFLVVCTSSMYGNPPKNFWEFYYHLKMASDNGKKPLAGLQHAVYGNGDETYYDTYMNVPRVVDLLLERAGSRRFCARGETSEPVTPMSLEMASAEDWAPGMWAAMQAADVNAPGVAWDAHWEGAEPNHHKEMTDWDMKHLEKKFGVPEDHPSMFAPMPAKM